MLKHAFRSDRSSRCPRLLGGGLVVMALLAGQRPATGQADPNLNSESAAGVTPQPPSGRQAATDATSAGSRSPRSVGPTRTEEMELEVGVPVRVTTMRPVERFIVSNRRHVRIVRENASTFELIGVAPGEVEITVELDTETGIDNRHYHVVVLPDESHGPTSGMLGELSELAEDARRPRLPARSRTIAPESSADAAQHSPLVEVPDRPMHTPAPPATEAADLAAAGEPPRQTNRTAGKHPQPAQPGAASVIVNPHVMPAASELEPTMQHTPANEGSTQSTAVSEDRVRLSLYLVRVTELSQRHESQFWDLPASSGARARIMDAKTLDEMTSHEKDGVAAEARALLFGNLPWSASSLSFSAQRPSPTLTRGEQMLATLPQRLKLTGEVLSPQAAILTIHPQSVQNHQRRRMSLRINSDQWLVIDGLYGEAGEEAISKKPLEALGRLPGFRKLMGNDVPQTRWMLVVRIQPMPAEGRQNRPDVARANQPAEIVPASAETETEPDHELHRQALATPIPQPSHARVSQSEPTLAEHTDRPAAIRQQTSGDPQGATEPVAGRLPADFDVPSAPQLPRSEVPQVAAEPVIPEQDPADRAVTSAESETLPQADGEAMSLQPEGLPRPTATVAAKKTGKYQAPRRKPRRYVLGRFGFTE